MPYSPELAECFLDDGTFDMKIENTKEVNFKPKEARLKQDEIPIMDGILDTWIKADIIERCNADEPCFGYVIPHLVHTPGDKTRLTFDCRHINQFFAPPPVDIPRPMVGLLLLNKDSKLFKIDITEAFNHIKLSPKLQKFFHFQVNGIRYRSKRMGFGWSMAPAIFQTLMKAILKRIHQLFGVLGEVMFDDCLFSRSNLNQETIDKVVKFFTQIGFEINLKKSILSPSEEIDWMKFHYNRHGVALSNEAYASYMKLKDLYLNNSTVGHALRLLGFL